MYSICVRCIFSSLARAICSATLFMSISSIFKLTLVDWGLDIDYGKLSLSWMSSLFILRWPQKAMGAGWSCGGISDKQFIWSLFWRAISWVVGSKCCVFARSSPGALSTWSIGSLSPLLKAALLRICYCSDLWLNSLFCSLLAREGLFSAPLFWRSPTWIVLNVGLWLISLCICRDWFK